VNRRKVRSGFEVGRSDSVKKDNSPASSHSLYYLHKRFPLLDMIEVVIAQCVYVIETCPLCHSHTILNHMVFFIPVLQATRF
jgi:hypothetical protein